MTDPQKEFSRTMSKAVSVVRLDMPADRYRQTAPNRDSDDEVARRDFEFALIDGKQS